MSRWGFSLLVRLFSEVGQESARENSLQWRRRIKASCVFMLQMLSSLKCRHFATVIKGHAIQISIMLCIQEAFKILTTSLSALDHIHIMNFALKSVKFIYLFIL